MLNKHPHLKKRIEQLLKIVENSDRNLQKADDAEQRVIDELRKMGNDALHDWTANRKKQEYKWLELQKTRMKEENMVLQSLSPYLEPLSIEDKNAPVCQKLLSLYDKPLGSV